MLSFFSLSIHGAPGPGAKTEEQLILGERLHTGLASERSLSPTQSTLRARGTSDKRGATARARADSDDGVFQLGGSAQCARAMLPWFVSDQLVSGLDR